MFPTKRFGLNPPTAWMLGRVGCDQICRTPVSLEPVLDQETLYEILGSCVGETTAGNLGCAHVIANLGEPFVLGTGKRKDYSLFDFCKLANCITLKGHTRYSVCNRYYQCNEYWRRRVLGTTD